MTSSRRWVREGLVVGLIAYAAVAAFYAGFDVLAQRDPIHTVDLLGRAVFRGLRDPGVLLFPLEHDYAAIFWYNLLHLGLALAIGLVVTAMVDHAERHPARAFAVLAALVAGGIVTVLLVGYLTEPMRAVLPWWSIAVANAFAALLAGAYLLSRRPGLWRRFLPVVPAGQH